MADSNSPASAASSPPSAAAPAQPEMTPSRFVTMAVKELMTAFQGDYDLPEIWALIRSFFPQENAALFATASRVVGDSPIAVGDPTVWQLKRMVRFLTGFHAGSVTKDELMAFAEELQLKHSQHPLMTGFHFHVRSLLDPENPRYQLGRFVCRTPFEQLDVLAGSSHLCCASWLHKSAGSMMTSDHQAVWNSPDAESIRQSVLDGTYRYCNKTACPTIAGGNLIPKETLVQDAWWSDVLAGGIGKIDRYPKRVNLAYDNHCNLSCPSCRPGMITSNEEKRVALDKITERNIYPLLAKAEEVYVTGSGDPFASRTFRKLLGWISDESAPHLKVVLMTNGMLFTAKEWAKFPNLKGKVKLVKVSMDGARKESHEKLRRGSKWEVMMENLPFIGTLLQKGEIESYELVFVLQQDNYAEMGEFVDLAKRVGANRVYLEKITNWGTFSDDEFRHKAVYNSTHPEFAQFLAAMADERLRDPMVIMPSLEQYLPENREKAAQ